MPGYVGLSSTKQPRGLPRDVQVLIVPSSDLWNDFGYRVHSSVGIRRPDGDFEWVLGFVAFQEASSSDDAVRSLLKAAQREWVLAKDIALPFASMLRNVKGYQALIALRGREDAQVLSEQAQDVCLATALGRSLERWPAFFESDEFTLSFMRWGEAAFALRHAGDILCGRVSAVEDSRRDFQVTLGHDEGAPVVSFRFPESPLGSHRIAALIGKNGAGKTHSLATVTSALLHGRHAPMDAAGIGFSGLLVFAPSRSLASYRARLSDTGFDPQRAFPLDPSTAIAGNAEYTKRLAAICREGTEGASIFRTVRGLMAKHFPGIEVQVPLREAGGQASWALEGEYFHPFERLRDSGEQACLRRVASIDETRGLMFTDVSHRPRDLSLGQEVFLAFLLTFYSECAPASIVVIDEPENYLHPNLISQFMRLLHDILSSASSIAILATHSPFVVREVPREQVHVLSLKDGRVEVATPRLQTLGAHVGAISDYVFGDDLVEHLSEVMLRAAMTGSLTVEEVVERFKDHVSLDAVMAIRASQARFEGGEG